MAATRALSVKVVEIDHIVLRVKDPVASVEWYCRNFGLKPDRLEDYKAQKPGVPFPSVRVTPTFLIDFMKAEDAPEGAPGRQNVDHFCFVVSSSSIEAVKQELESAGINAEEQFDGYVVKRYGAQGNARSIYIRDPDQNVVELRTYDMVETQVQQQTRQSGHIVTENTVQEGSGV
jgi:catechol 2,3-dioxygenase-like lactoylglutathione lyase family enzyme